MMSHSATETFYPLLHQLVDGYVKHKLHQAHFQNVMCKQEFSACQTNSVHPRVTSLYLKIIGDEITSANRKLGNRLSSAAADQAILRYPEFFNDATFEEELHTSPENLSHIITKMGELVFKGKKHWGAYAAFLAFGASLAIYCSKREALVNCVDQVVELLTMSLCENLDSWFNKNGGWDKLGKTYIEDKQYYTAAVLRKIEYSKMCQLESSKLDLAKCYLNVYEVAKKATELMQSVPSIHEESVLCRSASARSMVLAISKIEDQQRALSMADEALSVVRKFPHLSAKFQTLSQTTIHIYRYPGFFDTFEILGELFLDLKKYKESIWCLKNALALNETHFKNDLGADLNYNIGVALVRLDSDSVQESEAVNSSQARKSNIDEAIAKLQKAAKMYADKHQFKSDLSAEQVEHFCSIEADCYYYLGKAFFQNGDFECAHRTHQKGLTIKNMLNLGVQNDSDTVTSSWVKLGSHRRASWSAAPDMAKMLNETKDPQSTDNFSITDGIRQVARDRDTQQSRERGAVGGRDGSMESQISNEGVKHGLVRYTPITPLWGPAAVDDIFPALIEDLHLTVPTKYAPTPLESEQTITLTSEMEEFINASSADEVVDKLAVCLKVDCKALEMPDTQTCEVVRCFTHCMRSRGRTDIVQAMKRRLPQGTAGPLVPEDILVRDLPRSTINNLAIALSGGNEWMQFAGHLGMPMEKMRFLDKRAFNPAAIVLECVATMTDMTTGQLYDILKCCGLEGYSEKL